MKKFLATRPACQLVLVGTLSLLLLMPQAAISQDQEEPATKSGSALLAEAANAREHGDSERELELLQEALSANSERGPEAFKIYGQLRQLYADLGNFSMAIQAADRQINLASNPGQQHAVLVALIPLHASLNQFQSASANLERLERVMTTLRSTPHWARKKDWWQAGYAKARAAIETQSGHLERAEDAWKTCTTSAQLALKSEPGREGSALFLDCSRGLIKILMATGQLGAAGQFADQLRVEAGRVLEMKRRPTIMIRVNQILAQLAVEQGKLEQARGLLEQTVAAFDNTTGLGTSMRLSNLQMQLATIEMLQGNWAKALAWHQKREAALVHGKQERGNKGARSPEYAYTLVRLGKPALAVEILRSILAYRSGIYDENSLYLWESRAFLGVALAASGRRDEAMHELRAAIPRILEIARGERASSESGALRTARLNWLLEAYIGLLAESARDGDETALDEAFRMADLARGSTVQRALAVAASRANIADPALADLARREQDMQREISSFSEAIGNLLSRGRIAEQDKVVAEMRAKLNTLRDELAKAQAEIERRYPEYAALLNPKSVGISAIQKLLKPTEAVISIYAGSDRSAVWAIPAQGRPSFAMVALTGKQLDHQVMSLRESLDPNLVVTGGEPPFRFDLSHELYKELLAPVEAGWKGAQELIIIPHGSLSQLPFGVLTTARFQVKPARPDYAEMLDAPWLIKQVAISQLPAAIAMPALRAQNQGMKAERPFVGFGDPIFMANAARGAPSASQMRGIQRRNLIPPQKQPAKSDTPGIDSEFAPPINFSLLPQLPETALEIEEVARVLSADQTRDIFLGHRASESLLKKTDLTHYRVIMFATHGLMNNEMPGVYQPALAMSNPSITGDGEDGMLTMEEILGLKLKADWVVLSACNSGAADGHSSESVSGLGRAFFYAGSKSLLVTNWAVETESARMLTTELFRLQATDPKLSRARALQLSSLSLMNKSAGNKFSYAHPMFWAPYSLIGDGGL